MDTIVNLLKDPAEATRNDYYCQFPLAVLSMPLAFPDLLSHILSYTMINTGEGLYKGFELQEERPQQWSIFIHRLEEHRLPWPYREGDEGRYQDEQYFKLFLGASKLRLQSKRPELVIREFEAVKLHTAQIGNECMVRLKLTNCCEVMAMAPGSLSQREFEVLCAIYSKIGSKGHVRMTYREIIQRACGFANKNDFERLCDQAAVLTESMVRTTVEKLRQKRFFARVLLHNRYSHYSHRMPEDELRTKLFERETGADGRRALWTSKNNELSLKIKLQKQAIRQSRTRSAPYWS